MNEKLKDVLEQIEARTSKGRNICTSKLVKHCIDLGIDIPKLYMELHKKGKMRYLR
jgi:hypothetical protein